MALNNADGYTLFALAVFIYHMGWLYVDGKANRSWSATTALGKTLTEVSHELLELEKDEFAGLDAMLQESKYFQDLQVADSDMSSSFGDSISSTNDSNT